MITAKNIILWLALAFACFLPASALTPTATENRVWEIFSIGYDAPVAEATDLENRTETSTSNYDTAPIHHAITEEIPTEANRVLFGPNAEFKAAERIDSAAVRFSQDSISGAFKDGRSVDDLASGLKNGSIDAGSVPAIRLVNKDGQLFTLDNRRLAAFQQAGVAVPYRMATAEEAANEAWKFTTKNGGTSIRVRK